MGTPYLSIDLARIEHNARAIVELCAGHGIEVVGVTKATCGSPEVARAMLRGGCTAIGDSRIANLRRLEEAGVERPTMLLRVPPLSRIEEVASIADVSLHSELTVLAALSEAAQHSGEVCDVIVMVDLGDLREGVWWDDVVPFVGRVLELSGVRLVGLGANLTCYGGVIPTERNMGRLARLVEEVEQTFGLRLECVSGGNSSALPLIAAGRMPPAINQVRVGEAILLGRETIHREPWPGTAQDAFLLHAEVIESKQKPSVPIGERAEDAFGGRPPFEDLGELERVLLNLGREDVELTGLDPLDDRLRILGASSDYLIIDATRAKSRLRVGDEVVFALNYAALLAAMDSTYVEKRYHGAPR